MNKMKYKIGDIVIVHNKKKFDMDCGKMPEGEYYFVDEMYKYCGKPLIIEYINKENKCYYVKDNDYEWCDYMFDHEKTEKIKQIIKSK